MKDLYTFDATPENALKTYDIVQEAYTAFFNEFKIPYLVARAASGDIGGDLSHEYHFPTSKGEDNIISCNTCDYVANEELAESRATRAQCLPYIDCLNEGKDDGREGDISHERTGNKHWYGISQDRNTLFKVFLPQKVEVQCKSGTIHRDTEVNPYLLRKKFPELDLSVEDPLSTFLKQENIFGSSSVSSERKRVLYIFDERAIPNAPQAIVGRAEESFLKLESQGFSVEVINYRPEQLLDLVRIGTGDPCPKCKEGTLNSQRAVEIGHTFHLGTRYSTPLGAEVTMDPSNAASRDGPSSNVSETPLQMGCHGIGMSRLIAAIADSLADSKGLNWPRVMAPFEVVIVPTKSQESEVADVYDHLMSGPPYSSSIDVIIDDRRKDFGWKLKDADMIGYPVIVVVGRNWQKDRMCEVQCRRLGDYKELVNVKDLSATVNELLQRL